MISGKPRRSWARGEDPTRASRSRTGRWWIGRTLAVVVLALLLAGCADQSEYPDRPITLICPWSAGGGTDRVARQLASQLERELGVPVNVVNATGGGGVTGHTRGAQARPDGYTLTLITAELTMLHWRGLTTITHDDFRPLALVNQDNAGLFVLQDAPWTSLAQLQDEIRERPGELRASGTAFGGVWHLSLAGWLIEMDLSPTAVNWVSLGGAAPALQELMAGGLEVVVCSPPEAQSLLDADRIRALGVMSEERLPAFSNIPTFQEQGFEWTSGTWRGLALPDGVPEERYEILSDAVQTVLNSEEYAQFLESAGFGRSEVPPEQTDDFLREQDEQNGEVLTSEAFQSVQSQQYGAWLFPSIVIGLILLVALPLLWTNELIRASEAEEITTDGTRRVVLSIAAVAFYILIAEVAGFIITSAVLLGILFWRYGAKWYVSLAVPAVLVPLTYQLFAIYLRVPLPRGWFGW